MHSFRCRCQLKNSRYRGNDSDCGEGFLHPAFLLSARALWRPLDLFGDSTILLANAKVRQTKEDGDLNTSSLIDDPTLPATVIDYLKRVQTVVWNRKFFLCQPTNGTESESLVGIGSSTIKEGDIVCVLFGCSVPVVLGRVSTRADWFLLRGESYVHGKMEGGALVGMDEETITAGTVEFTIR
jgi:hypothetical protein